MHVQPEAHLERGGMTREMRHVGASQRDRLRFTLDTPRAVMNCTTLTNDAATS
jgi:hypothetical protein